MIFSVSVFCLLFDICFTDDFNIKSLSLKYHVSTDAQNWFQALINCKSSGMDLVSIPTKAEQESLDSFLKTYGYNNKEYWLSGTNLGNGSFVWASTGAPMEYTNWLPNQPDNAKLPNNNSRGENCTFWGTTSNQTGWGDLFCGHKLQYICEDSEMCNKIN